MRKVTWTETNQYGDAQFEFKTITPPDEVEGKAKWDADREKRQAERRKNASPETLARVAEIKARV